MSLHDKSQADTALSLSLKFSRGVYKRTNTNTCDGNLIKIPNIKVKVQEEHTLMLMPKSKSKSQSQCTAAAVTVLPLLSMRQAFNEANCRKMGLQKQKQIQPRPKTVALSRVAVASPSQETSEPEPEAEVEDDSHKLFTDNDTDKGVAWYVERAAEEDINARLIRDVKDLKQLLGGRTAQVDCLRAEIANLQQQLNNKNKNKSKNNSSTFLSQPGDVDVSFSPSLMSTQTQTVKVAAEMEFGDLESEAMARGMDSTTVLKMTKETLLQELVVGTMCISKSKAWSKVASLRHDIENDKAAIRELESNKQQEQDVLDKKCKLPKQEIEMYLVTETEKEAHHQDQDKLKNTTTDVADTGSRGAGSINCSPLKVKAHRIVNAKWQSNTESKLKATPPPPAPVKCPRKDEDERTITMSKVSPLSRKLDNVFEINDDDDDDADDDDDNDDDNTTNLTAEAELHSHSAGSGSGYLSLAGLDDEKNTHPSHALIRRHIIEAFITPAASALAVPNTKHQEEKRRHGGISISGKRKLQRQQRYAGFVGLRCRYCKHKRIDEQADLAVIYPESIGGIYRANIRFQKKHIQACSYIPKRLKRKLISLKETCQSNTRGKVSYWTESALQNGFRNWTSPTGRNGIVFRPEKTQDQENKK